MSSLTVYDRTGKEVGKYDINPTDLAPRINRQLLHDAVVMYQSNQRLGTAQTKSRGMVTGSTKKMYRQKGTGNARAGSRRSGIRRGGGHIFAKAPRDWTFRMPRKALQLATRMALASKLKDGQITLIDELKFDAPRTRDMAAIVKALGHADRTLLLATAGHDSNVYKSARNIRNLSVVPAAELNAWLVLKPSQLLLTKAALEGIKEQAKAANSKREPAKAGAK